MKKRNISIILIAMFSIASLTASMTENIDTLISYAINNNSDYIIASSDVDSALDNLDDDPLIYGSSISVEGKYSNISSASDFDSTLSAQVLLLDQLTLDADIDTNLDGNVGLTYSPLVKADSSIKDELEYENSSVYLSEYKESLRVEISQAYVNYLLAIKDVELQEQQVSHDLKKYEQEKELYKYDQSSLIDVQDALVTYSESKNDILDLELAVYKAKISIYELIGIEENSNQPIETADIYNIINLTSDNDSILDGKDFSVMSDYDVVKSLNSTISLEDSYDSLAWYEPTLNFNANVSLDGDITGSVVFKTSFDDFNGDEKESLENDIYLSKLSSASTITKTQNSINLLEKSIESDKQSIEDIKLQIDQNELVLDEAKALLELDEYEALDYETLEINANKLDLSLLKAYASLYLDQLNLINYL